MEGRLFAVHAANPSSIPSTDRCGLKTKPQDEKKAAGPVQDMAARGRAQPTAGFLTLGVPHDPSHQGTASA